MKAICVKNIYTILWVGYYNLTIGKIYDVKYHPSNTYARYNDKGDWIACDLS